MHRNVCLSELRRAGHQREGSGGICIKEVFMITPSGMAGEEVIPVLIHCGRVGLRGRG